MECDDNFRFHITKFAPQAILWSTVSFSTHHLERILHNSNYIWNIHFWFLAKPFTGRRNCVWLCWKGELHQHLANLYLTDTYFNLNIFLLSFPYYFNSPFQNFPKYIPIKHKKQILGFVCHVLCARHSFKHFMVHHLLPLGTGGKTEI